MAISTPLPKAFEYRRCLAKFSFNSRLYYYIQKSHSIGTASLTMHSTIKNSALSLASRAIISLTTPSATPRTATSYIASPRLLPSIYRAILSSSLVYKAYLTVQDLYIRYAPCKSIHLVKLVLKIRVASYLTV